MTRLSGVGGTDGSSSRDLVAGLRDVNVDDFLQLMITELQNQDPLNPMDNAQMLSQISQIREIAATEELSTALGDGLVSTLNDLSLGQKLSSAGSLMGRRIHGVTKENTHIVGVVQRVSVKDGVPTLHVSVEKEVDAAGSDIPLDASRPGAREVALDKVVDIVSADADWEDLLPSQSK